jgi:hypothetical protein
MFIWLRREVVRPIITYLLVNTPVLCKVSWINLLEMSDWRLSVFNQNSTN